ncbi:hypothetical protein N7G274_002162 [Stereocaulon virgatum]|uniref:Uncharacterized protein n=1 Tax=Stereocaulon virgatum TaxID=373712 RepID=A0ABR4AJQ1_9LECA
MKNLSAITTYTRVFIARRYFLHVLLSADLRSEASGTSQAQHGGLMNGAESMAGRIAWTNRKRSTKNTGTETEKEKDLVAGTSGRKKEAGKILNMELEKGRLNQKAGKICRYLHTDHERSSHTTVDSFAFL